MTLVVRQGDPAAALAVAVFTEGGAQLSTALAAATEARLRAAGFASVDLRPGPDGYRLRMLASSPEHAAAFVEAARAAMSMPLSASSPELAFAARRVQALRARPFDSPLGARIAHCTNELGFPPGEAALEVTSPAGLASLEALRKSSHTIHRVAFAVVGPSPTAESVAAAVQSGPPWEPGTLPGDPWPEADALGVHPETIHADGPANLTIAIRVRDAYAATAIAQHAAVPDSPLLTRVSNASPWRLVRSTATVRPRGACISLRLERDRTEDGASIESDAARVAGLVVHEVQTELAEARADGSVAGLQVLRAADPRDAAALAAWWSLAARLEGGPDRVAIDLGVPPPRVSAPDPANSFDQQLESSRQRFVAGFNKARDAWARPVVDGRIRLETGQGELWLLVASPCGVLADTERDAGTTALAAVAAAYAHPQADSVSVEPWITQDGVGVLAHAQPARGEGPHALARRVADAAARSIISRHMPERALNLARGRLLAMVEQPTSPFGPAFTALASSLAPAHPAWIAPYGTYESLAKTGLDIASHRWESLAKGPIRVAVLANHDQAQADAAVRAVDRWMLRRVDHTRACPPLPRTSEPASSGRDTTVRLAAASAHALLGVAIHAPDTASLTMLDLLAEGLDGADGWLARALTKLPGTNASVRVMGGSRLAVLVVEVTGREPQLDDAIRQVKGTLQRLAAGAATAPHLERASQRLAARELEARLDPRRRLADVWSGRAERLTPITLEAWNAWLSTALEDSRLSVVRALTGAGGD